MFLQCGSTKDEKRVTHRVPSYVGGELCHFSRLLGLKTLRKEWGKRQTPLDTSGRDIFDIFCSNINRDIETCLPHKDGCDGTRGKRELGEKRAKQEVKFIPNL